MKETMYSGVDTLDGCKSLMWVCGGIMAISSDFGSGDPWRDAEINDSPHQYPTFTHDPSRFTDLTLVWERDV